MASATGCSSPRRTRSPAKIHTAAADCRYAALRGVCRPAPAVAEADGSGCFLAGSADRHRQLLKLAVQDVYVRQHARSAPTQISAQYTPHQAYTPTVYAHLRTDDQPRIPWYPQAQCAMPYATGRDRTRRVPSSGRVSARIRTQADTKGINITWEIC